MSDVRCDIVTVGPAPSGVRVRRCGVGPGAIRARSRRSSVDWARYGVRSTGDGARLACCVVRSACAGARSRRASVMSASCGVDSTWCWINSLRTGIDFPRWGVASTRIGGDRVRIVVDRVRSVADRRRCVVHLRCCVTNCGRNVARSRRAMGDRAGSVANRWCVATELRGVNAISPRRNAKFDVRNARSTVMNASSRDCNAKVWRLNRNRWGVNGSACRSRARCTSIATSSRRDEVDSSASVVDLSYALMNWWSAAASFAERRAKCDARPQQWAAMRAESCPLLSNTPRTPKNTHSFLACARVAARRAGRYDADMTHGTYNCSYDDGWMRRRGGTDPSYVRFRLSWRLRK